jgi:hypothetical protein
VGKKDTKQISGIFEALSSFIVRRSIVIAGWRGAGNDK